MWAYHLKRKILSTNNASSRRTRKKFQNPVSAMAQVVVLDYDQPITKR